MSETKEVSEMTGAEKLRKSRELFMYVLEKKAHAGKLVLELLEHPDATADYFETVCKAAQTVRAMMEDVVTKLRAKYPAVGGYYNDELRRPWLKPEYDKYHKKED